MTEISSFLGIRQHNTMHNSDDNRNTSHCDERTADQENMLNRNTANEMSKNHHANFNTINSMGDMNNDENSSNLNIAERLNIVGKKEYNANLCVERRESIEKSLAHSRNQKIVKDGINTSEWLTDVTDNKMLQKNIQGLTVFGEIKSKECGNSGERNENKEKHGGLCGSLKYKTASMNLSRKAKSFFRKKSRLAIVDSNCTLILPGPRRARDKQYEKTRGRLKVSRFLNRRSGITLHELYNESSLMRRNRVESLVR